MKPIISEQEARNKPACVCGRYKYGPAIVCWDCWRKPGGLKHYIGTFEEWQNSQLVDGLSKGEVVPGGVK